MTNQQYHIFYVGTYICIKIYKKKVWRHVYEIENVTSFLQRSRVGNGKTGNLGARVSKELYL